MITVAGKLWCASNNTIKILNPETFNCEVKKIKFGFKILKFNLRIKSL